VNAAERKYWPIREAYWLDRILEEDSERRTFVLGADHVERFCARIMKRKKSPSAFTEPGVTAKLRQRPGRYGIARKPVCRQAAGGFLVWR